jgi:hypothetical protein
MKQLTPITIGNHIIQVSIRTLGPGVLEVFATCGDTSRSGSLTLHPKHDRTDDHLQQEIGDLAQRLAEEAAGHEQSRLLTETFFSS